MGNIIYTARCVRCGMYEHTYIPVKDGTVISHATGWYDHNGLGRSTPCCGPFVSVMGRTREEVRDKEEEYRKRGTKYFVLLRSGDEIAWLGTDGLAHQGPTPSPDQAVFDTAYSAAAAPVPDGWTATVVHSRY